MTVRSSATRTRRRRKKPAERVMILGKTEAKLARKSKGTPNESIASTAAASDDAGEKPATELAATAAEPEVPEASAAPATTSSELVPGVPDVSEPLVAAEAQAAPESSNDVGAPPTPPLIADPTTLEGRDAAEPAPAPGLVPPGDSRSFRRGVGEDEEFCLIYRWNRSLVTRRGRVGEFGAVAVVDYPTESRAAHAYALRSSQLQGEGFADYRE